MEKYIMKTFLTIALIGASALGMNGCTDVNSNKTTTVKKETKIDSNGNEKTKIETKTEETTVRTTEPAPTQETTTVRTIEVRNDPIIKLGPLEIKN
jgi:hypothetical protein